MSHVLMSLLLRAFRSKSCINALARKLESGDPKDNANYITVLIVQKDTLAKHQKRYRQD